MKMYTFTLAITTIFGLSKASVISQTCPDVTAFPNFDFDKYLGTWYELQRYENHFEKGGICVREILEKIGDGKAKFSHIMTSSETQELVVQTGILEKSSEESSNGLLKIKYDATSRSSDYIVLQTDYDNYAIVWSCAKTGHGILEFAWVLSRNPQNSKPLSDEIKEKLESTPIKIEKLLNTPHTCDSVE